MKPPPSHALLPAHRHAVFDACSLPCPFAPAPLPPAANNWTTNIGHCMVPTSVDVQGLTIPLSCLWPGQQMV